MLVTAAALLFAINVTVVLYVELRDRRYDRSVETALDVDRPLTAAQVDRMVEAYRQSRLRYRAEVIARTESLRVMSQAQAEAMTQTLEQTGIDRGLVVKEWMTNIDGRERPTHHAANGQRRLLDALFNVGTSRMLYPGDPRGALDERIECRCVPSHVIAKDADEVAGLLAA